MTMTMTIDDLVFGMIYVVRFSIFTTHIGCIHRTLLSEGTDFFCFRF
jgi:hypothetical protein